MYTVLLVDDSEVALLEWKRMKRWGESCGFTVYAEARDGYQALKRLEEHPVDLVITDIRMPKVDGIELLQKVMERKLAKLVVFASDYCDFSYARQGIVLGAFDYIVKPVTEEDLARLLKRVAAELAEINENRQYLKQLEEELERAAFLHYSEYEFQQLAAAILAGDPTTGTTARKVIAALADSLEPPKIVLIVQKGLGEIIDRVAHELPWLERFADLNRLRRFDCGNDQNVVAMAEQFGSLTADLAATVKRLSFGERSGIVAQVSDYVLEHIDRAITLQSLSEALFLHRSHVSEVFREKTGQRVSQYITLVKLERAKKLFSDGALLTYQVAEQLGYKDVEYFSRLFKKHTGVTPSQYLALKSS